MVGKSGGGYEDLSRNVDEGLKWRGADNREGGKERS